jgi:hypothetical protein
MTYLMNHWTFEIYSALFNCFPELLKADCHPPSLKLKQVDGESCVKLHLQIISDTIIPTL